MTLEHFMKKNYPVLGTQLPDYSTFGRDFHGTESWEWHNLASQILKAQRLPYHCGSVTLGDGNCFFHALVDQLKDNEIRWTISERASQLFEDPSDSMLFMTFREAIVEFCRNDEELNNSEWGTIWKAEFLNDLQKRSPKYPREKIWEKCLRDMSNFGEYATALFIRATALFFEKDILVIEEETNYRILGSHNGISKNPPLAMVHMCRVHFQSAIRNQNEVQPSQARQVVAPELKLSSGDSTNDKCRACGTTVNQIKKHLAKVPSCREFYSEDELRTESLEKRKLSIATYSIGKQDEAKQKKEGYKNTIAEKKNLRSKELFSYNAKSPRKVQQAQLKEFVHVKYGSRFDKVPMDGSDGKCHHCEAAFGSIALAKLHAEEVHGPNKFQCHLCEGTFSRQKALSRHVASAHEGSTKCVCPYCKRELSRKDKLDQHIRDIHEKKKTLKCPNCPLTFARRDTLEKHISRASLDPTKHGVEEHCASCGQDILYPTGNAYQNQRHNCPCKNDRKSAK